MQEVEARLVSIYSLTSSATSVFSHSPYICRILPLLVCVCVSGVLLDYPCLMVTDGIRLSGPGEEEMDECLERSRFTRSAKYCSISTYHIQISHVTFA